eukprot:2759945-Prymnesium_polylepis.1
MPVEQPAAAHGPHRVRDMVHTGDFCARRVDLRRVALLRAQQLRRAALRAVVEVEQHGVEP